jgi:hypothetical protein
MKRLNLVMAIVALLCTVAMDVLYPFVVPVSGSNLGIVCILSAFGFIATWIYFDNYITMVKKEAAFHAESKIKREQKERLARELGHSDGAISDMADRDMQELDNIKQLKKMTVTKKFYREDGRWYIDLPEFLEAGLGNKNNLLMVDGADTLLDKLAGNKPNKSADGTEVNVTFGNEPFDNYTHTLNKKVMGKNQALLDYLGHAPVDYGAYYDVKELDGHQVWLCPVTEYVFDGEYPKTIYLKEGY